MGVSLKDALQQAGFQKTKKENERKHIPKTRKMKSEIHQEERNFCEVCSSVQPDVEKYKHRNQLLVAEWICCNCADEYLIHDQFRITEQSDFSKKKTFSRRYGPTLNVEENKKNFLKPQKGRSNPNKKY